jgi:sugar phosphate isomerase/epimerase
MSSRRRFLEQAGTFAAGATLLPAISMALSPQMVTNPGIQLYTFRKEMLADAAGTLKQIAALGIKQIESAGSDKGYYYGLKPKEMKQICSDLGMTLCSGHIQVDDKFQQTISDAVDAGQEYLICSSMPAKGQTVDNYKKAAEAFNRSGEACKKANLKFGYHNHDYEFEQEHGKVLYDVLVENTDAALVNLEMDLGWVIASGKDPVAYFNKFPGRFPLWHLKDMDLVKKQSVEFGKGGLDIVKMLHNAKQAGMKYFFIEQEEYSTSPLESMKENMEYLKKIKL